MRLQKNSMKRISEYKKLFGVENEVELKALKTRYRDLVKEWHPDKFQDGDPLQEEAEMHSRKIIDGYHFLVSIGFMPFKNSLRDNLALICSLWPLSTVFYCLMSNVN